MSSTALDHDECVTVSARQAGPDGLRILVLVHGSLDERVSGPEIRGWEIAKGLAGRHGVTVAVRDRDRSTREEIRLVPSTRRSLAREAMRHDVIIAPCAPPYLFLAKLWRSTIVVSDHYDPVDLELATLEDDPGAVREVKTARAVRRLQLGFSDIVLVAGEGQRRRVMEELEDLGEPDHRSESVLELPFGLPPPPPPSGRRPIRERFSQIEPNDTVVLWWGSVWRWLDVETVIRAIEPLVDSRPDIKLVITAGQRPEADRERHSAAESARSLARSLGLLDRTVLFIDDWLPYAERQDYLGEADLGITLHSDTAEARVAARARYMDYLWASLPCVLARGDEVAARFERAGFARLVPANDPPAVRKSLLKLADSQHELERARGAAAPLAELYQWETLVQQLADVLEDSGPKSRLRPTEALALVAGASAYYSQRVGDAIHGVWSGLRRRDGHPQARATAAGAEVGHRANK